jgi:hypothetical protein
MRHGKPVAVAGNRRPRRLAWIEPGERLDVRRRMGRACARRGAASGSLVLALAAVGVHTAAMLITTGVIATGVCRGVAMHPRLLSGTAPRQAWTAALAVTGVLVMALR